MNTRLSFKMHFFLIWMHLCLLFQPKMGKHWNIQASWVTFDEPYCANLYCVKPEEQAKQTDSSQTDACACFSIIRGPASGLAKVDPLNTEKIHDWKTKSELCQLWLWLHRNISKNCVKIGSASIFYLSWKIPISCWLYWLIALELTSRKMLTF